VARLDDRIALVADVVACLVSDDARWINAHLV
jgi:hypothetical protein